MSTRDKLLTATPFWQSSAGIFLQIIIVVIPPALFLTSGALLLPGLLISVLLSRAGLGLRNLGWPDVGLVRPSNPGSVLFTAILSTAGLIVLTFVLRHVVTSFTHQGPNLEAFKAVKGDPVKLLLGLIIAWVFGGFGEELFFRGFLVNSIQLLFTKFRFPERFAWAMALMITSVMVGLGHMYQGITGMILTAVVGFCLGLIYLKSKRNLWPCVLTHGLYDTIAFILVFSGLSLDQLIRI